MMRSTCPLLALLITASLGSPLQGCALSHELDDGDGGVAPTRDTGVITRPDGGPPPPIDAGPPPPPPIDAGPACEPVMENRILGVGPTGRLSVETTEVYGYYGCWEPLPYSLILGGFSEDGQPVYMEIISEPGFPLGPSMARVLFEHGGTFYEIDAEVEVFVFDGPDPRPEPSPSYRYDMQVRAVGEGLDLRATLSGVFCYWVTNPC